MLNNPVGFCIVNYYSISIFILGNLVMAKMSTPANMLFNYLLSHKENYPMKVIRVAMPGQELDDNPLSIGSVSFYRLFKKPVAKQK